ncbi:MAG: flagellar type III secretion system protein FlhB [Pseudomonadota bacterium]
MADDEDNEKPFQPTPRKLEEARRRGEMPISQDLTTFSVYAAFLIVFSALSTWSLNKSSLALLPYLSIPNQLAQQIFESSSSPLQQSMISEFSRGIILWFLFPFIFALFLAFLQGAIVFPSRKIQPKISKISLIKNFKQKYGLDGLFQFLKSFIKLLIYSTVLYLVFAKHGEIIVSTPTLDVYEILIAVFEISFEFLLISSVVMLALAMVDYFWQRSQFLRRQGMTLKELKDELKETEGDPYTRQARQQKAQDIASNQMLTEMRDAEVVIVNPTHFAVALKWDRKRGTAPICIAKGIDQIAVRIREVAAENSIPIFRDPTTARALFSTTKIGEEVPINLYQAIAAAIRFADAIRRRAKGLR